MDYPPPQPCPDDEEAFSDEEMPTDPEDDGGIYPSDDDYNQELIPSPEPVVVLSGQGQRPVPSMSWELIQVNNDRQVKKFHMLQRSATFKTTHNVTDIMDLKEFCDSIDEGFEGAVLQLTSDCDPTDIISVTVRANGLTEPLYVEHKKLENFDKTSFLRALFRVAQSNTQFLLDGLFDVTINIYKTLQGSGRSKRSAVGLKDPTTTRCVISISAKGQWCGYCAVAVGLKYHEWDVANDCSQSRWRSLVNNESSQKRVGRELCDAIGLNFNTPMNIEILTQIQSYLQNEYQIIVIIKQTGLQDFKGPDADKEIYLLLDIKTEHYSLIKKITNYLKRSFYCKHCHKGYQHIRDHKCDKTCHFCRGLTKCQPDGQNHNCKNCNKNFQNNQCFENHIKNNCCRDLKYCQECEMDYQFDKKHAHKCDEFKCHHCNEYFTQQPHYCYLKTLDANKLHEDDNTPKIIVCFDIESMLIQDNNGVITHVPILVCVKVVCTQCWNDSIDNSIPNCLLCDGKDYAYYGKDCVQRLNDLIINNLSKKAAKVKGYVYVIAHNLSGYDGHWAFTDLMRRNMQNITPIMRGTKLMKIDMDNVRYIDSLLYFQRPLADLPKMFDIEDTAKEFFPHMFNTPANQNVNTPYSSLTLDDFGIKTMTSKRAHELVVWLNEQCAKNNIFNLKQEMKKYCEMDVKILIQTIMRFRKLFKQVTSLDPTSRAFTLASVGLEFFRTEVMRDNEIGITPIKGYAPSRKQSAAAKAWLDIWEIKMGGHMVREGRVGKYFADGLIQDMDFVFEFLGCYFHGHDCNSRYYDVTKRQQWEEKKAYYHKRNYSLEFIWECEWKQQLKNDSLLNHQFQQLKQYHQNVETNDLYCVPRKALHGGRTNNLKFHHVCEGNEQLFYYDFTSLYPYVLSRRSFPTGHPNRITSDFASIDTYFGFAICKVLPPKQLYLPVLPMVINGKLSFPLCNYCATIQSQGSCSCDDNSRCLIDTFTTPELQKAIQLGYKVIEIYEVLHYTTQSADLFKGYMDRFYKLKAEASGYPKHVVTQQQKIDYIYEFKVVEGIELELEKIAQNPGFRSIAKLMLNSLWGKLAQRPNMPETKIVSTYPELYDILTNEDYEILGDQLFDETIVLNYKQKDDSKANPRNTSVAIACFVTAYARLKLYEELEKIEESRPGSVLYFDTDSVVFVNTPGAYKPTVKNFLGEMTDEVTEKYGVGSKMVEFYTCGPKVYSYKIVKPDGTTVEKFKAKGLTQTTEANKHLNYNTIKDTAINRNTVTKVPQMQFRCTRRHEVFTKFMDKDFRLTSDKRRILGNDTLPYGYVDYILNN